MIPVAHEYANLLGNPLISILPEKKLIQLSAISRENIINVC